MNARRTRKRTAVADDIRLSCGFLAHPKTRRLRRRHGADAVLALIGLFAWAAQNRYDGNLAGLTDEDIEDVADWDGAPGALVAALVDLRWLDGPGGLRVIHEWAEHNPYAATKGKRIARARAAASARWEGQAKLPLADPEDPAPPDPEGGGCSEHATSIEKDATSIESDASSNAQSDWKQCPPHHTTPHHTPEGSARVREAAPEAKSRASEVGAALVLAGCPDAAAHPALPGALAAGVDCQALMAVAREKPGKGLLYLLATLRGRAADALSVSGFASQSVHSSAGVGASPVRQSEDPETARRNAEAHWRNLGFDFDSNGLLVGGPGKIEQGASQ